MKDLFARYKISLLLGFSFFVYLCVILSSEGYLFGSDDLNHYFISRYSIHHPYLLLDLWGKPIFSLLGLPFAQLGFRGMLLYTALAAITGAYFSYKIAEKLKLKMAWLAVIFVCFSPIYFKMANSGMTEIVFAAALTIAIYLFISKKYIAAIIIMSFLPFIRSEGYLIFPIIVLALTLRKKMKLIPFILTGYVIYSVIGFFYYKDIFWIQNSNPYSSGTSTYGKSGDLVYFLEHYYEILGLPLTILLISGIAFFIYKLIKKKRSKNEFLIEELFLIGGFSFAVIAFHSYIFWKGIFGALGSVRLISICIPLLTIFCLMGLEPLQNFLSRHRTIRWLSSGLISIMVIIIPFLQMELPVKYDRIQELVVKASYWLLDQGFEDQIFCYLHPVFGHQLGLDPFDKSKVIQDFRDVEKIPTGSIFIWDGKFCPVEGKTPLKKFIENENFMLLKVFTPKVGFKIFDTHFEIYIFQKIEDGKKVSRGITELFRNNFETITTDCDKQYYCNELSKSGMYSFKLDGSKEYICSKTLFVKDYPKDNYTKLKVACSMFPTGDLSKNQFNLVITALHEGESYLYKTINAKDIKEIELNSWNEISLECIVPEEKSREDIIKVYLWYRGSEPVYIDDYVISKQQM